jgi:hypothetical protein
MPFHRVASYKAVVLCKANLETLTGLAPPYGVPFAGHDLNIHIHTSWSF